MICHHHHLNVVVPRVTSTTTKIPVITVFITMKSIRYFRRYNHHLTNMKPHVDTLFVTSSTFVPWWEWKIHNPTGLHWRSFKKNILYIEINIYVSFAFLYRLLLLDNVFLHSIYLHIYIFMLWMHCFVVCWTISMTHFTSFSIKYRR